MKFWVFAAIVIFGSFMTSVIEHMIEDKNVIIRAFGYVVAIASAIFLLWFVLIYFFDINFIAWV